MRVENSSVGRRIKSAVNWLVQDFRDLGLRIRDAQGSEIYRADLRRRLKERAAVSSQRLVQLRASRQRRMQTGYHVNNGRIEYFT